MSLSVGIVGLPNVGKSTLFNALLSKQQAYAANYPFATIEPNVGIVPVPDERLTKLAEVVHTEVIKPATVEFLDIAGLVAGASQGEGLGNKFLAHIRGVSVILHVVRVFPDSQIVREGSVTPKSDFETIKLELELADLEMEERRKEKLKKKNENLEELSLFRDKPSIIVLNVGEGDLAHASELEKKYAREIGVEAEQVVAISARVEEELAELSENERVEYLASLGVYESGLQKLIKKAYQTLGLMSYLTAGEKEVRAWTIVRGTKAPQAAGVIHTDFEKKFISARVCNYPDFVQYGGWKMAAEKGMVRQEGREYLIRPDDVVEFMIGA